MMRLRFLFTILILFSPAAFAQQEPDSSAELEQLLKPEPNQSATSTQDDETPEKPAAGAEAVDPKELSDLGRLAPFSDIAVIQKRFLPKTSRFEFFPNVGYITNDVFFFNPIIGGRLAYYFTEQYGVEATFFASSKSEREVVRSIRDKGVLTEGLVFPQSYYGLDFKWTPVYGKMGFMTKSIIPFDHYFSLGGGVTNTNQKTTPTTVHFGTGQIYAISKWLAARWDLGCYWYSSSTSVGRTGGGSFMNLHLTIGASFFFPEASYR